MSTCHLLPTIFSTFLLLFIVHLNIRFSTQYFPLDVNECSRDTRELTAHGGAETRLEVSSASVPEGTHSVWMVSHAEVYINSKRRAALMAGGVGLVSG